jgi:hypothetical protein
MDTELMELSSEYIILIKLSLQTFYNILKTS